MSGNPKGFPLLFYPLFSCNHTFCQQARRIVHDNINIFTLFNHENLHPIDFFFYICNVQTKENNM